MTASNATWKKLAEEAISLQISKDQVDRSTNRFRVRMVIEEILEDSDETDRWIQLDETVSATNLQNWIQHVGRLTPKIFTGLEGIFAFWIRPVKQNQPVSLGNYGQGQLGPTYGKIPAIKALRGLYSDAITFPDHFFAEVHSAYGPPVITDWKQPAGRIKNLAQSIELETTTSVGCQCQIGGSLSLRTAKRILDEIGIDNPKEGMYNILLHTTQDKVDQMIAANPEIEFTQVDFNDSGCTREAMIISSKPINQIKK
jgi:hypothetical protein